MSINKDMDADMIMNEMNNSGKASNESNSSVNYKDAGVDIDNADDLKRQIGRTVSAQSLTHCTPLNRVGAFASLVEIKLEDYRNPVFVLKSEEPGSKQLLSIDNGRVEWIARDLINHLVNDIAVMGAAPCAVLDTIICGKLEQDTVLRLINEMSRACAENGCILVGGETSEQPGVIPAGRYILQASVLGIVDRDRIIDGTGIADGDDVIALASNGLHTNGYSLVRKLIETKPEILNEIIGGNSFTDSILIPHTPYSQTVKRLLELHRDAIHGMAHITGGGIHDNLIRILHAGEPQSGEPHSGEPRIDEPHTGEPHIDEQHSGEPQHAGELRAVIDLSQLRTPPVFGVIRKYAGASDPEMLRTFNCGVGMIIVADGNSSGAILQTISDVGGTAYPIGKIVKGARDVSFINEIEWRCSI